ncbi:MAG: hypothetical protein IJ326_01730 [Lachnospiraceae bacterium]|nr:hypothetical protein [Lachnospiraceae bacterium]
MTREEKQIADLEKEVLRLREVVEKKNAEIDKLYLRIDDMTEEEFLEHFV